MTYYIIIILFYFFCAFLEVGYPISNRWRAIYTFILVLPMWALAAFRSVAIGNDTIMYEYAYNDVLWQDTVGQLLGGGYRFEQGYLLLCWICSRLGLSFFQFQIVLESLIYLSFASVIKKYSINVAFTCLWFFTNDWGGTVNVLRMYCAMAILVHTIPFIRKRKIIPFLLLVVLAFFFHRSAILFVMLYPLCMVKNDRRLIVLILLMSAIIAWLGTRFFSWATDTVGVYEGYLESGYFEGINTMAIILELLIVVIMILILKNVGLFKFHHYEASDGKAVITLEHVYTMVLFMVLALSIVGLSNTIMSRIIGYFDVLFMFVFAEALTLVNKKNRYSLFLILSAYTIARFFIILIYRPNWNHLVPYEWGFQF